MSCALHPSCTGEPGSSPEHPMQLATGLGELCVVHESCSGAEDDCRTERGTRPVDDDGEPVAGAGTHADDVSYREAIADGEVHRERALAAVEAAYVLAHLHWDSADWTHEYVLDGRAQRREDADGQPGDLIYCDGERAAAESDAEAAEEHGERAMDAARDARWGDAVTNAEAAARLEDKYGDAPTWGPFARAVREARDSAETEPATEPARREHLAAVADRRR